MTVLREAPVDETARALQAFRRTYSASTASGAVAAAVKSLVGSATADHTRLDAAVAHIGARVEVSSIAEAATLAVEAGQYVIRIRKSDPEPRRRFSIAHEIGHVLLFEGVASEPHFIRALAHRLENSAVERICDQAAAELLMPADGFRASLLSARFDWDHVMRLAAQFRVSHTAVLVRIVDVLDGARIVRFQRDPLTMGRSRQYERISTYGRQQLTLPRTIRSSQVRPRVLEAAEDRGRSVTRRLELVLRGEVVWQSPCIAIRERIASASLAESIKADQNPSPPVVAALFQPADVEPDAWRALAAR